MTDTNAAADSGTAGTGAGAPAPRTARVPVRA